MSQFGYFTDPAALRPTFDPGLEVDCLVCGKQLSMPIKTISLMLDGDNRSYFYRTHKKCYDSLSSIEQTDVDGLIIDAVAMSKNLN